MIRKAVCMKVKPNGIEQYTIKHNPIPDDVRDCLKRHKVSNYSIFFHEESSTLFGYFEAESIEELEKLNDYPCNHVWWKEMTKYLVSSSPDSPKAIEEELTEIFHLD